MYPLPRRAFRPHRFFTTLVGFLEFVPRITRTSGGSPTIPTVWLAGTVPTTRAVSTAGWKGRVFCSIATTLSFNSIFHGGVVGFFPVLRTLPAAVPVVSVVLPVPVSFTVSMPTSIFVFLSFTATALTVTIPPTVSIPVTFPVSITLPVAVVVLVTMGPLSSVPTTMSVVAFPVAPLPFTLARARTMGTAGAVGLGRVVARAVENIQLRTLIP